MGDEALCVYGKMITELTTPNIITGCYFSLLVVSFQLIEVEPKEGRLQPVDGRLIIFIYSFIRLFVYLLFILYTGTSVLVYRAVIKFLSSCSK